MTDLQISLIVLGVVIVGGVFGYNKWQESRARKNVERAFSDDPEDVLMTPKVAEPEAQTLAVEARVEPMFFDDDEPDASMQDEPAGQGAGVQESASERDVEAENEDAGDIPVASTPTGKAPIIDPGIDCTIPIPFEEGVRGERILPILQSLRHVGNKSVHFMGLVSDAENPAGNWQPIVHGLVYQGLQVGVQMANRTSALGEIEYSELLVRVREIADELSAEPDIPDMSDVMAQARELRQFVIDHDAKLSVNIRSNGESWEISTLLAVLERQGFGVRPDGRFEMLDATGAPLFTLLTNENVAAEYTSRLTLLLDVPRVAPEQDGFRLMSTCAKALAVRLNGLVVDDGDQLLTDDMLAQIDDQVQAFYQDMESAGVPAGSARALRLFV